MKTRNLALALVAFALFAVAIVWRSPEPIGPVPDEHVVEQRNSQGQTQTIKYTVTAQSSYDITVNLVFPDNSTQNGQHFDIHPISVSVAQALADGGVDSGAQELVMFNNWIFPQVIAIWQGNLIAAQNLAAAESLTAILNVQQTVTQ
jgi:hypothetical protein